MGLFINNEKVELSKTGAKTGVLKAVFDAYAYLKDTYMLDKGEVITLKYMPKVGAKNVITNMKGKTIGSSLKRPSMTGIPRKINVMVGGELVEIVYANKRKPIVKLDEKFYEYEPRESIKFSSMMKLGINDIDLILFLYLFNPIVENKPNQTIYTIESSMPPRLMFVNKKQKAESKFSKIKRESEILTILEGMESNALNAFALRLRIQKPSSYNRVVLIEEIFNKVANESNYDSIDSLFLQLKDFSKKYTKQYMETIDIVNSVLDKNIVVKIIDGVTVSYMNGDDLLFKTKIKNDKDNIEELYTYVAQNSDIVNLLKSKLK